MTPVEDNDLARQIVVLPPDKDYYHRGKIGMLSRCQSWPSSKDFRYLPSLACLLTVKSGRMCEYKRQHRMHRMQAVSQYKSGTIDLYKTSQLSQE